MGTDADANADADADAADAIIIAGGGGVEDGNIGSPSSSNDDPPSSSSSSRERERESGGNIGGGVGPFLAPENLCGRTLLGLVGRGHSICADVRMLSERVPDAFLAAAAGRHGGGKGGGGASGGGSGGGSSSSSSSSSFLSSIFQPSGGSGSGRASGSPDGGGNGGGGGKGGDASAASDEARNYSRFLFDFTYLHNPEEWEAGLSSSSLPPHPSSESSSSSPPTVVEEDLLELEREFAINHRSIIEEYYDLFYSIYEYQKHLNDFAVDLSGGYYIQYTVESVLLDADGRALLCEAIWLYGVMLMLMERFLPVSFVECVR